MKKVYVDSNVFISFWDKEYGRNITDFLEYYSEEVLNRVIGCEFFIVISDWTVKELMAREQVSREELMSALSPYQLIQKLEIVTPDSNDFEEAKRIKKQTGIHYPDSMHAALAKKAGAIIVTWNTKDFNLVKDIIEVRTPKEL